MIIVSLAYKFISNIGVRQRVTLIPHIFKAFINDLHEIVDGTCDPATLSDIKLNSLMFADDVIARNDR